MAPIPCTGRLYSSHYYGSISDSILGQASGTHGGTDGEPSAPRGAQSDNRAGRRSRRKDSVPRKLAVQSPLFADTNKASDSIFTDTTPTPKQEHYAPIAASILSDAHCPAPSGSIVIPRGISKYLSPQVVTQSQAPPPKVHGQPETRGNQSECVICAETKAAVEFPSIPNTAACKHPIGTCAVCVATSIASDLANKLWQEVRCPECREQLSHKDIQRHADTATKQK